LFSGDLNTNVVFSDFIFAKIYSKFDIRKQKLSLNHKKNKGNLTENRAKIKKKPLNICES
jgi:ubiquinone/menaquinone biosynthesis C-methylase UbiE